MKRVSISLVDEKLKADPSEDTPVFTLYLAEVPQTGDHILISHSEPVAYEDQSNDLYLFCRDVFPQKSRNIYEFAVVSRQFFRYDYESLINLNLTYVPIINFRKIEK